MRKAKIIVLILIYGYWLLRTGYFCFAEQAGSEILDFAEDVSIRSSAMGGCYTALPDNPDSGILNPACLPRTRAPLLTTMHARIQTDTDLYYLSYSQPVCSGTFAVSWIQAATEGILRTELATTEMDETNIIGTLNYYSNIYLLSYGCKVIDTLSIGVVVKYLTSGFPDMAGQYGSGLGYSADIGLLLSPSENLSFGLKVEDAINHQSLGTGTSERSPAILKTGISSTFPFFGNQLLLAQDVSQVLQPNYQPKACFGAELNVRNMSFRIGYNETPTAGFGVKSGSIEVNYAYINKDILSKENVHRVSLTYGF